MNNNTLIQEENQENNIEVVEIENNSLAEDIGDKSLEEYKELLEEKLKSPEWMTHDSIIQNIIKNFTKKSQEEYELKKEEFLSNKEEDDSEVFYYNSPVKKEFDSLKREYKSRKRKHFENVKITQDQNLERKTAIIEEIKNLINVNQDIRSIYKRFRELQQEWHKIGFVPIVKRNDVWQTYKHSIKIFYDFLYLNKELREKDFKYNYEEKVKIIEKAKELINHNNPMFAAHSINNLHIKWREDLGPVQKEYKEELWQQFQEITKAIYNKKEIFLKNKKEISLDNLKEKESILKKLEGILNKEITTTKGWVIAFDNFKDLQKQFNNVGFVDYKEGKENRKKFRKVTEQILKKRYQFFKELNKKIKDNKVFKKNLITELESILKDKKWRTFYERVKEINDEWEERGVNNKDTLEDKFRDLHYIYLDNYKLENEEIDFKVLEKKDKYYQNLEDLTFNEVKSEFLSQLDSIYKEWKMIGLNRTNKDFQVLKSTLYKVIEKQEKLNQELKSEYKFEVNLLDLRNNKKLFLKELSFIQRKIGEKIEELRIIENNLNFFNSSNGNNNILKNTITKKDNLTKEIDIWKKNLNAMQKVKKTMDF